MILIIIRHFVLSFKGDHRYKLLHFVAKHSHEIFLTSDQLTVPGCNLLVKTASEWHNFTEDKFH